MHRVNAVKSISKIPYVRLQELHQFCLVVAGHNIRYLVDVGADLGNSWTATQKESRIVMIPC